MLVCTTWKSRHLSPEQVARMMDVWAKTEALTAEASGTQELSWYLNADGSGGVAVAEVTDPDSAVALNATVCMALSEFLELESNVVIDKATATASIIQAQSLTGG